MSRHVGSQEHTLASEGLFFTQAMVFLVTEMSHSDHGTSTLIIQNQQVFMQT